MLIGTGWTWKRSRILPIHDASGKWRSRAPYGSFIRKVETLQFSHIKIYVIDLILQQQLLFCRVLMDSQVGGYHFMPMLWIHSWLQGDSLCKSRGGWSIQNSKQLAMLRNNSTLASSSSSSCSIRASSSSVAHNKQTYNITLKIVFYHDIATKTGSEWLSTSSAIETYGKHSRMQRLGFASRSFSGIRQC